MMHTHKGSALIMALLITAIVAAVSTAIAVHLRMIIRESQLAYNFEQAYCDLQGVQYWGKAQVIQNAKLNNEKHTVENYPQSMPNALFHNAQLSGEIDDAQGLFNINALANPAAQTQFIRLLKAVDNTLSDAQAAQITKSISDWINTSNVDTIYLKNNPPYRAAHQSMVSVSELRLISGISPKLYLALLPYVTALPVSDNQINIITAPVPVLRSLGANMTVDQANNLALCRQQYSTLQTIDDLKQACITKPGLQLDPNINLVIASNYFLIKSYAQLSNQNLALFSLIKRNMTTQNNMLKYSANVIWQTLNTL